MLELVDEAMAEGVSQKRICWALSVSERRIQRWRARLDDLGYERKPACRKSRPHNALTPEEKALVVKMTASREHADDSCRTMSAIAMDEHEMYISHVAFWRYQVDLEINGPRGIYARRRSKYGKPELEPTAPNQVWAWDISHIKRAQKYCFFYLYVIIDSFSRKVVGWHVDSILSSEVVLTLWDKALINEGFHANPIMKLPCSLSDRGSQMRSQSVKAFFKTLGIETHYARPRTPNDNPQIESFFSTVKCSPGYPERFLAKKEANDYFDKFFFWYNNEHYHTRLGMLRPADVHSGRHLMILEQRAAIKEKAMMTRRKFNCRVA